MKINIYNLSEFMWILKKNEGERTLMKENLLITSEWISYVGEKIRRSVGELGQLSIPRRFIRFRSVQEKSNMIKKEGPSSQGLTHARQTEETWTLCVRKGKYQMQNESIPVPVF